MYKTKNGLWFTVPLALTIMLSVSVAHAQNDKQINGQEHRNVVSNFVHTLLNMASSTTKPTGIGELVRAIAREQNMSSSTVADAIDRIQTRNRIKTFLIGSDYKNLGALRSEMVQTRNHIDQLMRLFNATSTASTTKTMLQDQIQALQVEQQKINAFVTTNENKFSLFGWFVKLFTR